MKTAESFDWGRTPRRAYKRRSVRDRLMERVVINAETQCWEWQGYKSKGYGQMGVGSERTYLTHRVSWELAHGPIDDGLFVCHKCDNRACCNPEHLFLGTNLDNVRDSMRKGRFSLQSGNKKPLTGESHGMSRFTEEQVREIRSLYREGVTQKAIGARFGVPQGHIHLIVKKKIWKHLAET